GCLGNNARDPIAVWDTNHFTLHSSSMIVTKEGILRVGANQRSTRQGQVFMTDMPRILNIQDIDIVARATRYRIGVNRVDTGGGGLTIELHPRKIPRRRWRN